MASLAPKFKELFSFGKKEVALVFSDARAVGRVDGFKLLKFNQPAPTGHGKLLIVASRAAGKAHRRNLIRRQAKAIFYENELWQAPCWWVLLVYRREDPLPFEQLKEFLCSRMG